MHGWILMMVSALAAASPEIARDGVMNAASRIAASVTGSQISRGSVVRIEGANFGTDAGHTSVQLIRGNGAIVLPVLTITPEVIEARVPDSALLGGAFIKVTTAGVSSPPFAVTVVRSAFGIYSRNQKGWGPGRIDPGNPARLYGTGLGPSATPEVWVGGVKARSTAVKRKDGLDTIDFEIPATAPPGCYVPVQVRVAGAPPSNTVTLAIRDASGQCPHEDVMPFTGIGRKAGVVVFSRLPRGDSFEEEIFAAFHHVTSESQLGPLAMLPPSSTCTSFGERPEAGVPSAVSSLFAGGAGAPLDAGSHLLLNNGRNVLRVPTTQTGVYQKRVARPFGGPLHIAGRGGSAIGEFSAPLAEPRSPSRTDLAAHTSIDRRHPLSVTWSGLDSAASVVLVVDSFDPANQVLGLCLCRAAAREGRIEIAPEWLAHLPQTRDGQPAATLSLIVFPPAPVPKILARGLDFGRLLSVWVQKAEVRVQ